MRDQRTVNAFFTSAFLFPFDIVALTQVWMMQEIPDRSPPLHWLTVLRYPAALWVILIHSLHLSGESDLVPNSIRKLFMERGFLGVPFFFILSGFILTYNYPVIRSRGDYLWARAGRILPDYYLSLLFSLPLMLSKAIAAKSLISSLPLVLAFLTLLQAWIPNCPSFWNYPAWTLSCEMFFYASLIIILNPLKNLISQSPGKSLLFLGGCFIFGLIMPAFFVVAYHNPSDLDLKRSTDYGLNFTKSLIEFYPVFHLAEFAAGVALCLGMRSRIRSLHKYAGGLLLAGFLQILSSLFIPAIFSLGTYCLPGFALIILGAAVLPFPDLNASGRWVRTAASTGILLGNASYAVYLFHIPILQYELSLNRHYFSFLPHGELGVWTLFAETTGMATFLSILIFYFFEEPARRWMVGRLKLRGYYFWAKAKNLRFGSTNKLNAPSSL